MKKTILYCLLSLVSVSTFAQTTSIIGIVTDKQGNPVPFAFVRDAQHSYASFTNGGGMFNFKADGATNLIASADGYKDINLKISDPHKVVIAMESDGLPKMSVDPTSDTFKADVTRGLEINGIKVGDYGGQAFRTHQEELHGSPYLFNNWTHGYVINTDNLIVEKSTYLFNYEKLTGRLLFTEDGKKVIVYDKAQMKMFALYDEQGTAYVFENIPSIDAKHFLQVLSAGSKYKIYKQVITKFVKANYTNNGVIASGNNYDEYEDTGIYYAVKAGGQPVKFTLKKKSLRTAFADEADKANAFLEANNVDDIDDKYLKAFGDAINN